jgi:hypothetical protein
MPTALSCDARLGKRAQARQSVRRKPSLLVGEVIDEVGAVRIVFSEVVVVNRFLDQPPRGNGGVDGVAAASVSTKSGSPSSSHRTGDYHS